MPSPLLFPSGPESWVSKTTRWSNHLTVYLTEATVKEQTEKCSPGAEGGQDLDIKTFLPIITKSWHSRDGDKDAWQSILQRICNALPILHTRQRKLSEMEVISQARELAGLGCLLELLVIRKGQADPHRPHYFTFKSPHTYSSFKNPLRSPIVKHPLGPFPVDSTLFVLLPSTWIHWPVNCCPLRLRHTLWPRGFHYWIVTWDCILDCICIW